LLLRLWTSSFRTTTDNGRRAVQRVGLRDIVDPATGRALGFASWKLQVGRAQLAWLARMVLEVRAAGSETLLFSVRRCWSLLPRWKVYDDAGRPLATLRDGAVLDRSGRVLVQIERSPREAFTRFVSAEGYELATLNHSPNGIRISFSDRLEGETEAFTKMAVLAAVLAVTPG
jgi:hypothetical protein